jgi:hypothetical protein
VIPAQAPRVTTGWEEVRTRADTDPALASLIDEVAALAVAYAGAALLVPPLLTANRRLVRLPALPMTAQ